MREYGCVNQGHYLRFAHALESPVTSFPGTLSFAPRSPGEPYNKGPIIVLFPQQDHRRREES